MQSFSTKTDMEQDINTLEYRLIESMRNDSIKAFSSIYELYAYKLLNYVKTATESAEDAEEIVHDIFMSLWKNRKTLDPNKSISALLFSMAYKKRIDYFRKSASSPIYEDYLEYSNSIPDIAISQIEYKEFLAIFKTALNSLPSKQKHIIILSRLKGFTNAEIARCLNISEKTVRNSLSIGLKLLKTELTKSTGRKF